MAKDIKRVMMGRASKADGQLFEEIIEDSLAEYERLGLATIQKTPEPMKIIKSLGNGKFVSCFTKQAQPDFKGCAWDGSCIVFDAKCTQADKILQSVVTDTQEAILDTYERMNAHCYIVVGLGFRKVYMVPWNVWKNMKNMFGHKYMNEKDLTPYKVKTFENNAMCFAILDRIEL